MPITEEAKSQSPDYYQRYKNLKRKLKLLIYENESFREELKRAQKKLLKVTRDKSFLLDRLLQYEAVDSSTSDSEETMSSDSEVDMKELQTIKRKKLSTDGSDSAVGSSNAGTTSGEASLKKKKPARKTQPIKTEPQQTIQPPALLDPLSISHGDGHMTSEEIERHLEAKQPLRDLLPEKAPLTVPAELFSNEPSGLDSEAAEVHGDSSPSNIAEGVNEDGLLIDLPE